MATEIFSTSHVAGKTVYFRIFDPSQGAGVNLYTWDFDDDQWETTLAGAADPKLEATEKTDAGGADRSVYMASYDVSNINSTTTPKKVLIQAVDDLAADKLIGETEVTIVSGQVVESVNTVSLGSAASQDIAREALGVSGTIWHVKYNASETMGNDALSWATADETAGPGVKTDIEAATGGDLVLLGVGTFALGADGITGPTNVNIDGAGIDRTVLTSTNGNVLSIDDARLSHLTVFATLTDGSFQNAVVFTTGATCDYVRVIGDTDGFRGDLRSETIRLNHCIADTNYDAATFTNCQSVEIDSCIFRATGPSSEGSNITRALAVLWSIGAFGLTFCKNSSLEALRGGGTTYGLIASGTVLLENCNISAIDNGNTVAGIRAEGVRNIYMFGGGIYTSNGLDTDLAIHNVGTGKVVLVGVDYDRTKTSNTGGGEIIDISSAEEAIKFFNLDHLALTPTAGADMTAELPDNTILSRIIAGGDTSTFIPATHSLKGVATAVWSATTRTLSSFGTLVTSIWSAATRTLTGSALSLGPTASRSRTDGYYTCSQGGTRGLYRRVLHWDGDDLEVADVNTITYSIYALSADDPTSRTIVDGHEAVSLTAADVFSEVQSDAWASDYNLKHIPDISSNDAFSEAGTEYLVEYTIMPTSGQKIIERIRVTAT